MSTTNPNSYEDYIKSMYDAKQTADTTALESAYNANLTDANAALAKIPAVYRQQANAAAATSEQNRAAFNEYAAGSGINSGVGSQARLSMNNALQNNLTTIGTNEANALSDAQLQINKIEQQHKDDIAAAAKSNNYDLAAAEYQVYTQQRAEAQNEINSLLAGGFSVDYISKHMPDVLALSGYGIPYLNALGNN